MDDCHALLKQDAGASEEFALAENDDRRFRH